MLLQTWRRRGGDVTSEQQDIIGRWIMPAVGALLTGAFGAYIGVETALARFDARITANEAVIAQIRTDIDSRERAQRDFERLSIRLDERLAVFGERLARIEQRLDKGE